LQQLPGNVSGKAARLLELDESSWLGQEEKFVALGDSMLNEKKAWEPYFLETVARDIQNKIEPAQLWELYLGTGTSGEKPYRFGFLLEKMIVEPVFPGIVQEIFRKLAFQLQSEESESNLRNIKESLLEVQNSLKREASESCLGVQNALQKEKEKGLSLLNALALCNITLRRTEKAVQSYPSNDKGWENLYRQVSRFEMEMEFLKELDRPLGNSLAVTLESWKRSYITSADKLLKQFTVHCRQETPTGRQTLAGLLRQFPAWVKKKKYSGGAYFFILDGARVDIWELLMEKIFSEMKLRFLKEGFTWALLPTVTENQLQPLKETGLLGHIVNVNENIISELLVEPASLLQAVNNRPQFQSPGQQPAAIRALKFDFVDDKVHTSRENLLTLSEEIAMQGKKKLWPVLDNLPGDSLVLIAADHGFCTNFHYTKLKKWEEPRYLHGGPTFFEILAPWGLLEKAP